MSNEEQPTSGLAQNDAEDLDTPDDATERLIRFIERGLSTGQSVLLGTVGALLLITVGVLDKFFSIGEWVMAVFTFLGMGCLNISVFLSPVLHQSLADLAKLLRSLFVLQAETPSGRTVQAESIERAISRIEELSRDISRQSVTLDLSADEDFKSTLISRLQDSMSSDIIEKIREEYGIAQVDRSLSETKTRLKDAIEKLGARVNLNLTVGVFIAASGISVLTYFVVHSSGVNAASEQLLYFIPRLTIVVIIEVFSYFFLRLYSSGLEDLKYYQNELTNVESHHSAVHTALAKGSEKQVEAVISALLSVDRNVPNKNDASRAKNGTNEKLKSQAVAELGKAVSTIINS